MNDEEVIDLPFETEPAQLYYGGAKLLPDLAARYSRLSTSVAQSRGEIDQGFSSGDSPSGGLPSIYAEWDRLRNTFQDLLARTATNLVGTGTALCAFAEQIDLADGNASAELNEAKQSIEVVEVPPPTKLGEDPPPIPAERPSGP